MWKQIWNMAKGLYLEFAVAKYNQDHMCFYFWKFWKFHHGNIMCYFDRIPQVKCSLVTVSQMWTCSAQTAAGNIAWPWSLRYDSIQQDLHPAHVAHILPSSPIPSCYFSLVCCPLLLPSPQCTQDRTSQNRMHSRHSVKLLKGPGLRMQEQENGHTFQMYKRKISILIVQKT